MPIVAMSMAIICLVWATCLKRYTDDYRCVVLALAVILDAVDSGVTAIIICAVVHANIAGQHFHICTADDIDLIITKH
jgi:hypothetical protein